MTEEARKSLTLASKDERPFRTGPVLTVAFGHFVNDGFAAFLSPLLPLIIRKLGLSLTLAGSLNTYFGLPSLLNPAIGLWSDRLDLRALVVLAPAGTAAAISMIGLAPSYAILSLLLVIAGIFSSALHVQGPAIVSRVSRLRVGTGMSLWMTAGELAVTFGPLFAVAAVSWLGLDGFVPVMALGAIASLILHFRLRGIPLQPPSQASPPPLKQTWRAMRRVIIPLSMILLFRSCMRVSLTVFLPTYIASGGESLWLGGSALAAVGLAGALGAMVAGTASDRADRRWVLLATLCSAPLLMILFLAVEDADSKPLLRLFILALTGFASLSTIPVMLAIVQEYGSDNPATANGLFMGVNFVIMAGAPLLVGWIGDRTDLHTAFSWSAFLALLAVPVVFLLPKFRTAIPASPGSSPAGPRID